MLAARTAGHRSLNLEGGGLPREQGYVVPMPKPFRVYDGGYGHPVLNRS